MSGFLMADLVATCTNPATNHSIDLPIRLHYTAADPYAVTLTLYPANEQPLEWLIGRSLLMQGFQATNFENAGEGDVRVWVWSSRYWIHLLPPEDQPALLSMRDKEMRHFLTATIAAVMPSTERIDIDGLIRQLLEEASS